MRQQLETQRFTGTHKKAPAPLGARACWDRGPLAPWGAITPIHANSHGTPHVLPERRAPSHRKTCLLPASQLRARAGAPHSRAHASCSSSPTAYHHFAINTVITGCDCTGRGGGRGEGRRDSPRRPTSPPPAGSRAHPRGLRDPPGQHLMAPGYSAAGSPRGAAGLLHPPHSRPAQPLPFRSPAPPEAPGQRGRGCARRQCPSVREAPARGRQGAGGNYRAQTGATHHPAAPPAPPPREDPGTGQDAPCTPAPATLPGAPRCLPAPGPGTPGGRGTPGTQNGSRCAWDRHPPRPRTVPLRCLPSPSARHPQECSGPPPVPAIPRAPRRGEGGATLTCSFAGVPGGGPFPALPPHAAAHGGAQRRRRSAWGRAGSALRPTTGPGAVQPPHPALSAGAAPPPETPRVAPGPAPPPQVRM